MTDSEDTKTDTQDIEIKISKEGLVRATFAGETVDITPGDVSGKASVKAYTTSVQVEPASSTSTAKKGNLVINIDDDLGGISVHGVDVIAATADSPLIIATNGTVSMETPTHPKTNNTPKDLKIGDRDTDDWIYIGRSPDTHRPLFVAPVDAGIMTWEDATKFAAALREQGMKDAHLPSKNELTRMFYYSALIGGFDHTGVPGDSWYWSSDSSRLFTDRAICMFFHQSGLPSVDKKCLLSTRMVRS